MRIEPLDGNVTGFTLKNVTTSLSISAKLDKTARSNTGVNPEVQCQVTCSGCVFTYHAGSLISVESGTVPAGATVFVSAQNPEAAANGYIINGGAPEHQGSSSFRLVITGDTTITLP
jgi:hypothetical protein